MDLFDKLFEPNGNKAVLFYYQEANTPISSKPRVPAPLLLYPIIPLGEMLSTGIMPTPSKSWMKRVTASDGTGDALTGLCIFFLRPNNSKNVTLANIAEELVCGCLDASTGRNILEILQEYLSEVMLPALQSGQNWGALQPHQVDDFFDTLKAYINFLRSK